MKERGGEGGWSERGARGEGEGGRRKTEGARVGGREGQGWRVQGGESGGWRVHGGESGGWRAGRLRAETKLTRAVGGCRSSRSRLRVG